MQLSDNLSLTSFQRLLLFDALLDLADFLLKLLQHRLSLLVLRVQIMHCLLLVRLSLLQLLLFQLFLPHLILEHRRFFIQLLQLLLDAADIFA